MPTGASADRFSGGQLAITVSPQTPKNALAVVINLAKLLQVDPFFLDADEYDAATAALEDVPILLSVGAVSIDGSITFLA